MSVIEVYETKDYSMFARMKGNRDPKVKRKIISSIKKVGYIMNPIMINEKNEICDGQNRFEALKDLGLPVHYYIVPGATIETARALNMGRSNWQPLDYVKSYAEDGNSSYQYFLNIITEYKLSVQQALGIVTNEIVTSGSKANKIVCDGQLYIDPNDHKRIERTLKMLKQMDNSIARMVGAPRVIITGIAWCLNVDGCDCKRLIEIINTKYTVLKPVVDSYPTYFLEDLSNLYNKGLKSSDKRILFDAIYREQR